MSEEQGKNDMSEEYKQSVSSDEASEKVKNVSSDEIGCPSCGSNNYKKRFFGGSKGLGFVCFIIALWVLVDEYEQNSNDPAFFIFVGVFILAGIVGFVSKKYRCIDCKKTF